MAGNPRAAHPVRGTSPPVVPFAMVLVLTAAALSVRAQGVVQGEGGAVAGPEQPAGLSGSWAAPLTEAALERNAGPIIGDWTGMPINAAARARAQSYAPGSLAEPENVCHFYTQWHFADTVYPLGIVAVTGGPTNEVVAWKILPKEDIPPMTIWMDGNGPPPPSKISDHPRGAYTVGHWEGNMLVAYTTDMKTEMARRNGAFVSDEATMTSFFILHSSSQMTVVYVLQDPLYLTQPYVYSRVYERVVGGPNSFSYPPCIPTFNGVAEGQVIFHLPGQNQDLDYMMRYFHIPEYASEGGADTMYPAFRDRLKAEYLKLYHTFSKKCTFLCSPGGSDGE
ncbi:MAG TPA: hypothetical protein VMD56_14345 [Steroidobacteraceae bacterium]|nr:hypothetical protein [Steroidobacteraceae bacterium]